jgi:guanylate kinase
LGNTHSISTGQIFKVNPPIKNISSNHVVKFSHYFSITLETQMNLKLIQEGNFVEEGEYQKNLYGTSIDSIRTVIRRSKVAICVMNAPSIAVMRKENLKPFVIFIKPANAEQIRNNVLREDRALNDEEIEQMICSGRVIEYDYGHLFDEIIINLSQNQTYRVRNNRSTSRLFSC